MIRIAFTHTGDVARRKARYSRRDWIVYKGKGGDVVGELAGRDSIKRALLATGTQGYFILYHGGGGSSIVTWSIGVNMWRNARYLYPQEQPHANAI